MRKVVVERHRAKMQREARAGRRKAIRSKVRAEYVAGAHFRKLVATVMRHAAPHQRRWFHERPKQVRRLHTALLREDRLAPAILRKAA